MGDPRERQFLECVCSRTGNVWHAAIEKHGDVWIFVDHYLPGRYKKLQHEAQREELRQKIIEQMSGLNDGSGSALPPPSQFEMKPIFQDSEVNINSISSYGFQCPYCNESDLLRCVVCSEISCMGEVDNARRTICVRCGSTLQFTDSPRTGNVGSTPTVVKAQKLGLKTGERAFPNNSQPKLPGGHEK